jgi:rhodanese-related sulfurtransferase
MPDTPVTISTPVIADEALFAVLDDFMANLPEDFFAIKPDVLAHELANHPFLLDIRLQAERDAGGYIDGSILIPFPDFLKRLDQLPAEKDARIVIYCTSGHRGSMVTMALHLLGYTNVVNLAGGLNAWKADGMEVAGLVDWEAVLSDFIANLPSAQGYYSISANELGTVRAEKPVFLVDVREPAEVEVTGHIKGAVNIPIRELLKNLDKLPAKDQKIIVYCEPCYSGAMGTIALRVLGYADVVNLDGGVSAWKNAGFSLEPGVPAPAKVVTPAPEVDATRLALLDAYLTAMPEDFSTVTADELNAEIVSGNIPLILDVRNESDSSADGSFEGAVLMPVQSLPANLAQLPADKVSAIVIICKSGHCGAIAKMYLNFLGYINVRILLAE